MRYMRSQERNAYMNHKKVAHEGFDSKNVLQRYLHKQADLNKIMKIIWRQVVKATHLPGTVKEIQA